jgi:ABC-type uncharacterized transport system YnjBCD permease subunit
MSPSDATLYFILAGLQFVAIILVVALGRRAYRRWRSREIHSYLDGLRERGVSLLFSDSPDEIVSGLQLLVRFGVRRPSSHVIARMAQLTQSEDTTTAVLARHGLDSITAVEDMINSAASRKEVDGLRAMH